MTKSAVIGLFVGLTIGFLPRAGSVAAATTTGSKPNVLIVFSDDHRYSGVHANGCGQIKTPNIDRLASEGLTFDNAYLMGAFTGATCVPSRAMLLTGRGLFQLQDRGKVIPEQHTMIGEAFRASGYSTRIVGKWHQDNASLARCFDSGGRMMSRGIYLTDHFRMPFWDWRDDGAYKKSDGYLLHYDRQGKIARRPLTKDDKKGPFGSEHDGPHTTEVWTEEAIDFIRKHDQQQPFLMYLAYHAPHDPRQAPRKFREMYDADEIVLPPSFMTQHPFDNGDNVTRDEKLAPFPRTIGDTKQQVADYYAIITHMDFHFGRVLHALEEKGLRESTLIVFAGDSGLAVGCHGLFGKQNLYNEDGIHVPLCFSGPGVPRGSRSDALCYSHDVFPTICQLAGIDIPASVQGRSLMPIIDGSRSEHRDGLYHAYLQYQRAYRKGDYKLIEYVKAPSERRGRAESMQKGSRVTQLFNVANDFWETENLAFYPEHEDRVTQLRADMKRAAELAGDIPENAGTAVDFWDHFD